MQRRDLAKDFIQARLLTLSYEHNDADMLKHLNLQSRPTVLEYEWVNAKVL